MTVCACVHEYARVVCVCVCVCVQYSLFCHKHLLELILWCDQWNAGYALTIKLPTSIQTQFCASVYVLCTVCVSVLDLQAVAGGRGEKVTLLVGRGPGGPSLLDVTGAVQGEGRIVFWAKKFSLAFSASESTAGLQENNITVRKGRYHYVVLKIHPSKASAI